MRSPDTALDPNFRKYTDGHRQLRNLAQTPTEHDNRPLFHYDRLAETDSEFGKEAPWRALRWHPTTGVEVCATTPDELAAYERQGYVSFPPNQHPTTINDALKNELDGLTAEDRAMVLSAARQARMDALTKKLSGLSDADIALVAGSVASAASKRKN